MTDLISSLSDAIVALNNASLRLPTKAEIEDIVHAQLQQAVLGIGSYPFFDFLPDKAADIKREREFLTARIRSHGAHELPSVSKAMLDARYAIAQSFKDQAALDLNMLGSVFVKRKPDGTSEVATQEALAARIFNEPFDKGAAPCPGSTDGKHAFSYDITIDEYRCFCGAKCSGLELRKR